MKLILKKGTTSYRANVFIQNSSLTTGAGLTGLVYNSAGLTAYQVRPGSAAAAITLATQTVTGAFSSGGFVEVDATNMPGVYRFDIPDAVLATGVDQAVVMLKGATNMAPCPIEIVLTGADLMSTTNLGLSKFADIETDTQDIQSRIPAALVSGLMAAYVQQMQNGVIQSGTFDTDAFSDVALSDAAAAEIALKVFSRVVEGSTTFEEAVRGWNAALLAMCSGLDSTTAKYRNLANTKDVLTATVDAFGNRTAVTRDLTP
jgi:hypothetical protein